MLDDQNYGKTNDEPIEDGLSALKRLAALDDAAGGDTQPDRPSQTPGVAEKIPDWLELLLAKYGEQASELVGIQPGLSVSAQPIVAEPLESDEVSEVASLLERMAAETGVEPLTDRLPTSVPARPEGEETEDQTPDWLSELAESRPGAPAPIEGPEGPEYWADEEEVPDWLKGLAGAALDQQAEEALPGPEEEVPDWMKDLGITSEQVEPALAEETPPPPEVETPDWLRDLDVVDIAAEEAPAVEPSPPEMPPTPPEMAAEAPAGAEEEVPDWLRDLQAAEEVPATERPSPEAAAEAESEVPDWLASMRRESLSPLEMMAEEETPAAAYLEGEGAEEPEWLAALRTTDEPEVLELDEKVVEAEEELPGWLAALRASQEMAETQPPVPELPPEPTLAEEPGIIVEPTEVEAALPETEEALPTLVPAEEEAGALDWLAEIEAAAEPLEYPEEEAAPVKAEAPPAAEEVPDWLRQMPPADLAAEEEILEIEKDTVETRRPPEWLVAEPVPDLGEEEGELPPPEEIPEILEAVPAAEEITPAEVPDWLLTLKPEEPEAAELREEEVVEAEDLLAGISGLLPIVEEEPEVEEEPIAALRSRMGVPAVPDVEGAQLFKEVVAERPEAEEKLEAEAVPEARGGRIVETLVWALIFIVLIAGIALALLAVLDRVAGTLGSTGFPDFFGSPLVIDPAPVNTFRAQVTRLPPDAVVVVSFDYSPATEAEMEPLAEIIVRDLLDNQARVIVVSLRPEGPMMAQRLFQRLGDEYPYAERVINLGYLPGQTAGVRSLAFLSSASVFQNWGETLDDYGAWQDVDSLDDVALIVPVSDTALAVRWWVEQMGPGTLADRPMVAAVSAAADTSVRPYYNRTDPKAGQLLGLVSGVTDAAAYENRLGQPDRAVKSLAAQSVAHLGLVVIGLGGTVVGFRMQAAREQ